MDKTPLIRALSGTQPAKKILVQEQDVADIIDGMNKKHRETEADYDRIAPFFADDDIYTVCYNLWKFCKDNLPYVEEDIEAQHLSAPITILKRSYSDCKCYALFIGGVLDALERMGYDLRWKYRFVPSSILKIDIGHVFVVVNEIDGERTNIWIDPVLNSFNEHYFYFIKRDEKISGISVGKKIAGFSVLPSRKMSIGATASSYYTTQSGQVFANDDRIRPNGLTADEMGLPYAMELLNKGNPGYDGRHPGSADAWWSNPPVTFWLNGKPYPLPPPNTVPGSQVPLMPLGLTVKYAPSFMGFTIPANFWKPVVVDNGGGGYQNKLRLTADPFPIQKVGPLTIDPNDAFLSSNDSLPLILLEAAVGPLINAFSSYPYANAFSSTNNIDDKMFNHRNADDLLQPSISKNVLQTVAPELEAAAQVLNVFVPGAGVAAGAAVKTAAGSSGGGTISQTLPGADGSAVAAPGLFTNSDGSTNYMPLIIIGGVAFLLLSKNSNR